MAVAFVRATEGSDVNTDVVLNIEVSAGSDRVLVVGFAYKSNSVLIPTSVVFNGTENFTLERSAADGGDAQCFFYYLTNPTVTTADVVITMPATVRMVGYVAYFTGVHQTTPFTGNTNEAQGTNDSPTVDISSAADEICIDILVQVSAGPDTAVATHTQICNGAAIGGGTDCRGAGQYVVGQATRTMNWSMSSDDHWNIIAGALQEPAGGVIEALAGVSAGVAGVLGNTKISKKIDGLSEGTALVSGNAKISKKITGAVAGICSVIGLITGTWALAAVSAGIATVTGDMKRFKAIATVVAGIASVSGAVKVSKKFIGSIIGIAIVSGTTKISKKIAGAIAGIATVTGASSITKKILGVCAGIASVTGDIKLFKIIAGIIAGLASVSGAIKVSKKLAGITVGICQVMGITKVARKLAGAVSGTASVIADLTVILILKILQLITKMFSQFNITSHYSRGLNLQTKERSDLDITSIIEGGG